MKVRVTVTRYIDIEMDEKFRKCACPISKVGKVPKELYEKAAIEASRICNIPLFGDYSTLGPEDEVIISGCCVDNGEAIFEL